MEARSSATAATADAATAQMSAQEGRGLTSQGTVGSHEPISGAGGGEPSAGHLVEGSEGSVTLAEAGEDAGSFTKLLVATGIASEDLEDFQVNRRCLTKLLGLAGLFTKKTQQQQDADIDAIFTAIDDDSSGKISAQEFDFYLSDHVEATDAVTAHRPTKLKHWVFLYVSPLGASGLYDPREHKKDHFLAIWMTLYKVMSVSFTWLSVFVLLLETLPEEQHFDTNFGYTHMGGTKLFSLEVMCQVFFTIELILWVVCYPHGGGKQIPCFLQRERLWSDLATIIPFYVMLGVPPDSRLGVARGDWPKLFFIARAPRMLRALRLMRSLIIILGRVNAQRVPRVPQVARALRRAGMSLLWYVLIVMILMSISGTLLFFAELHETYFDFNITTQQQYLDGTITTRTKGAWIRLPDSQYSDYGSEVPLQSIPESLWWAIVTITTVGYGDYYPLTIWGKVVAGFTMMCGIVTVALPITVIGNAFSDINQEAARSIKEKRLCSAVFNGITRLHTELVQEKEKEAREEKLLEIRKAVGLIADSPSYRISPGGVSPRCDSGQGALQRAKTMSKGQFSGLNISERKSPGRRQSDFGPVAQIFKQLQDGQDAILQELKALRGKVDSIEERLPLGVMKEAGDLSQALTSVEDVNASGQGKDNLNEWARVA